ncbi:transglutaminase-like domain-containing protein [Aliifodinibius sp. S!AR15-10]|uniref:transglutaminase-like domain-containing protein n=1 Tax=Aliifodinibius sp. S!AR15-10 TaxID=2950437 RepID=UPI00286FAF32|nr:transglutaminase-like domain-containing protein [Aliifodinibius sp. S!AR15-10]
MSSHYPHITPSRNAVTTDGLVMSNKAAANPLQGDAAAPIISRRRTYPGIEQVLKVASQLVTKYTGRDDIRKLALKITRRVPRNISTGLPNLRNADQIADSIYKWMTRNINYVRDPWNIERIQSPDVTLKQKAGDCDDHAILSAALLQSLGIQTGFRIVSRTGRNYDHIYTVFRSPDGWKSFDTTVAKYPGFAFDETLIKKSKHLPNRMPDGLGIDPITLTAAATTALQTGVTMKSMFSKWFGAKDKDERIQRGQWRDYLMARGVRSDVISFSQKDNAVLQQYAMIIQEHGQPAVDYLNRFGSLDNSFLASQQQSRNKKWLLYGGLSAGLLTLGGISYWTLNHS